MPRMLSRRSFTKAALLSSIAPQMVSHANADNSAASDTRTIKNIAGSIQCSEIGSWNLERLNYILNEKITGFSNQKVQYPSAKYPVRLYKIEYPSVIPTHNNRSVRLSVQPPCYVPMIWRFSKIVSGTGGRMRRA